MTITAPRICIARFEPGAKFCCLTGQHACSPARLGQAYLNSNVRPCAHTADGCEGSTGHEGPSAPHVVAVPIQCPKRKKCGAWAPQTGHGRNTRAQPRNNIYKKIAVASSKCHEWPKRRLVCHRHLISSACGGCQSGLVLCPPRHSMTCSGQSDPSPRGLDGVGLDARQHRFPWQQGPSAPGFRP